MNAAQLFRHLCANCAQTKPDHESQLKPRVGLTLAQAQSVWQKAVEKAAGRKITARLVRTAPHDLQLAASPPPKRSSPQSKADQRKAINSAIGELLVLLSQKAGHDVLTERVEALQL